MYVSTIKRMINNNTISQQINVKKYPSTIWCLDSNPLLLNYESPPIISRTETCLNKSTLVSFRLEDYLEYDSRVIS